MGHYLYFFWQYIQTKTKNTMIQTAVEGNEMEGEIFGEREGGVDEFGEVCSMKRK